jgi:hypothetical protein
MLVSVDHEFLATSLALHRTNGTSVCTYFNIGHIINKINKHCMNICMSVHVCVCVCVYINTKVY